MRVFSRKVAELGAEVDELDEAKSVLNTLSNATGSINRLVRTHTHIPDPELEPAAMLRQRSCSNSNWNGPNTGISPTSGAHQKEIAAQEEKSAAWMTDHPELQDDSSNPS